jgi:hypothetical protein
VVRADIDVDVDADVDVNVGLGVGVDVGVVVQSMVIDSTRPLLPFFSFLGRVPRRYGV